MPNRDVVIDIPQQYVPVDENSTPTSNGDKCPIQEHVSILSLADENPTPISNGDKCPIQEHVPIMSPVDENPTPTSIGDKCPIQEHVPILTPADENPTPTSNGDKFPIQEHVPILSLVDENPTPTSNGNKFPIQEHVPTDEDRQTSPEQLLISRLQKEIEESSEQCSSSEQITKIQAIPQDYYRPRAMTIGPIFKFEKGHKLKYKLAAQFIRNSVKTINYFLGKVKDEIEILSTCFDDKVLWCFTQLQNNCTDLNNRTDLASTLFLDGCSTLQFIYSRVWGKLKELKIDIGQASLIKQDLFLMENQIPFRVLEILMDGMSKDGAFTRTVLEKSIDSFIGMNLLMPKNILKRSYLEFGGKCVVHLLDILRSGLLYAFDRTNISSASNCSSNNESQKEYFRNIQELKAAGIKLESSGISCLGDVTYTSFGWFRARLKLPPLIVNDSTGRKLWNLVAYEMCPENCKSDHGVTSYVRFLDSLIDSEEDVKELRSARILRNHLSSDNEVAKLFNEIGFNNAFDQVYPVVKKKIQKRFDSSCAMWIAQFLQQYVRNSWTFISLLGAMAGLLVLKAIQTRFTIHPPK